MFSMVTRGSLACQPTTHRSVSLSADKPISWWDQHGRHCKRACCGRPVGTLCLCRSKHVALHKKETQLDEGSTPVRRKQQARASKTLPMGKFLIAKRSAIWRARHSSCTGSNGWSRSSSRQVAPAPLWHTAHSPTGGHVAALTIEFPQEHCTVEFETLLPWVWCICTYLRKVLIWSKHSPEQSSG